MVRVESASGKQWSAVRSGSSYCSQSDLARIFGLAKNPIVSAIEVEWPSGMKDRVTNVPINQAVTIEEGKGLAPRISTAERDPLATSP